MTVSVHSCFDLITIVQISASGAPSLTAAMSWSVLHVWIRNLWPFATKYNETWNSAHLPSYVCISFINSEMTRRIREERDLAVRVMGRCVEAFVVNKLATDIKSRRTLASNDALVSNDELACLSAILGTKSDEVKLLLKHPGAIEFTNMVFFALGDFYSTASATVSPNVSDVVQMTFEILSSALPAQFTARMQLDPANTLMNISGGECELVL